ncbi:hypothetical protein V6N12_063278 [Hibiscus sabdariffa]|uniref:Uncharacterized protein n=1 Tax=Hibiscus sabdariffa TaxID=183260 RepID=A0ABR2FBK0_9ROSI
MSGSYLFFGGRGIGPKADVQATQRRYFINYASLFHMHRISELEYDSDFSELTLLQFLSAELVRPALS